MNQQVEGNVIANLFGDSEFVGLQIIDIDIFSELRESIGDDGVFCDLMIIYFNSAEILINSLEVNLVDQDANKFNLAAHSLKSTSASIGAVKLSKICKHLEQFSKMGNIDLPMEIITAVNHEYEKVTDSIKSLVLEIMDKNN
jgi:HPt (histidine-containing phosphotransfer) domain-containing protein